MIKLEHLGLVHAAAPWSKTTDRLNLPLRETAHHAPRRCR
jgi:hypothetical protein